MSAPSLDALLVNTRDAAKLLACSAGHIRNLVGRGELLPIRLGALLRFSVDDLRALIARQRRATAEPAADPPTERGE